MLFMFGALLLGVSWYLFSGGLSRRKVRWDGRRFNAGSSLLVGFSETFLAQLTLILGGSFILSSAGLKGGPGLVGDLSFAELATALIFNVICSFGGSLGVFFSILFFRRSGNFDAYSVAWNSKSLEFRDYLGRTRSITPAQITSMEEPEGFKRFIGPPPRIYLRDEHLIYLHVLPAELREFLRRETRSAKF
ncbi:MAG: hypothetical protein AAGC81_16825 [Pseudomonadota bacterium]